MKQEPYVFIQSVRLNKLNAFLISIKQVGTDRFDEPHFTKNTLVALTVFEIHKGTQFQGGIWCDFFNSSAGNNLFLLTRFVDALKYS